MQKDSVVKEKKSLRDRIRLHRKTYFVDPQRIACSVNEHQVILAALMQNKPTLAAEQMDQHLVSYIHLGTDS